LKLPCAEASEKVDSPRIEYGAGSIFTGMTDSEVKSKKTLEEQKVKNQKIRNIIFAIFIGFFIFGCESCNGPTTHYRRSIYSPDFSPNGKKIAFIQETEKYDQNDNPSTIFEPTGEFNQEYNFKIIICDLATNDSSVLYEFDTVTSAQALQLYSLDWAPNQNILLGAYKKIYELKLNANYDFQSKTEIYSTDQSISFATARWNYDGTMIGVETSKSDSKILILYSDGSLFKNLNTYIGLAWQKTKNIIASAVGTKLIVYDVENDEKVEYNLTDWWPEDWIDDNKLLIYKGYIFNITDSSIIKIPLDSNAHNLQVSETGDKIISDDNGLNKVTIYDINGNKLKSIGQFLK